MNNRRLILELEKTRQLFDTETVNDNLYIWNLVLTGPYETPYEGGSFLIEILFDERYPFMCPKIKFLTKIYHPNINQKGEICLGLLEETWRPSCTVITVLDYILAFLKEPNPNSALVPELAVQYRDRRQDFEISAKKWTETYAK